MRDHTPTPSPCLIPLPFPHIPICVMLLPIAGTNFFLLHPLHFNNPEIIPIITDSNANRTSSHLNSLPVTPIQYQPACAINLNDVIHHRTIHSRIIKTHQDYSVMLIVRPSPGVRSISYLDSSHPNHTPHILNKCWSMR